ncbi:MAG: polysaccharide biosynthesis tyrosine autokinase [Bacteroidaceae bacterium]|nr:polysaccharide biosynthesis tyrosine autokinase [Bacteroidaceae bacterium]
MAMQEYDNINVDKENDEGGFDIRVILDYLRAYWKLFVLSVVVCCAFAFVYLRYATPVYNVTAKVLLQDSEKGGSVLSPADMLVDFGMQNRMSNVENEIELMSSMAVVRGAVLDAELYIKYQWGKDSTLYKNTTPYIVSLDEAALSWLYDVMTIDVVAGSDGQTTLSYGFGKELSEYEPVPSFPHVIELPVGKITISRNANVEQTQGNLLAMVSPLNKVAGRYKSALSVYPLSKTASVAVLSYNTPDPLEGATFLNSIMESFNNVTNETKRQVACRTEAFISERLRSLKKELEEMEGSLAAYKKQNELVDTKLDVTMVSQKKAEYVKLLEQIDLKIEASKYMNDFVNNPKNNMQVIPASFGVDLDPSLVALINSYNSKVVERKTLLLTASDDNLLLKNSTAVVAAMQDDLRAALQALDQSLSIERKAVAILADKYTGRFEMSPEVERQLLTITRECNIKSDLYVMLLQKYEETLLSIEVQSDNLSCIDAPLSSGIVSPNRKMIYLIALFIGLLLPVAFIYIRHIMRNKFDSVDEVQDAVKAPYLGSIPLNDNRGKQKDAPERPIVVEKNKNDVMAEAFRTLRTNLQFVMKKTSGKVIMFTSTVSGEGKTFIASNLAVSTALLGKKVLLVGCDIRRPRLAEVFNFSSSIKGLTSYLAAQEDEVKLLDNLIIPSKLVDGFDLLPAGIIPPNPAELLSGSNLDRAIEHLRDKYDYIIFDAAPAGLVSDSIIASRVADIVAYVVRIGYTHKADAKFIESLIKEKKFENVAVVVNGDDLNRKSYGAQGSNRYSTYGYSYLDDSKRK